MKEETFDEITFKSDKQSINELFQRTLRFKDSREFVEFFRFIGKFTYYSHYNAMLIYLQNPNVDFFGSPGFWKREFKRTIKENARPYIALIPFGPCMLVYDIYDTEGDESPQSIIDRKIQGGVFKVKGNISRYIFEKVFDVAHSYGIRIDSRFLRFNYGGFVASEFGENKSVEITLHEKATEEETFKTLMHELAHLFLGHLGDKTFIKKTKKKDGSVKEEKLKIKGRNLRESMREIEAETVSYLICSRLFLETRAMEYLSQHLNDTNLDKVDIQCIISTADRIEKIFLR